MAVTREVANKTLAEAKGAEMAERKELPFGSEFSPSQIKLQVLLDLALAHEGEREKLEKAIQTHFFGSHGGGDIRSQKTLAMNCRLGMKAYGLIDEDEILTDFGRELCKVKDDEPKLYEILGRHILLHRHGMALVQCIRDMTAAGEAINLTRLRQGLAARGVHYPRGGKHPSIMKLWLAKAGVFSGAHWQIDDLRLQTVLGTNPDDFGVLARFSPQQRAFLRALASTGVTKPQPSNEIAKLAAATSDVEFSEKSLPRLVLNALVDAGYITATKTTKGRGSKPHMVAPTSKLNSDVVMPMLAQLTDQIDPKLHELLRKPLDDILVEIDSDDRYVSGLGLEALAFRLMMLLDMDYVATRLRAQATGGAEVDLIFESARLVFSRWQIQCKNTARVSLDDVAKEVGLTHFLKSNVIVLVSTGDIGAEARRYANKIMSDSNLCVVMIDRSDLTSIRKSPAHVVDAFRREAKAAMALKKLKP